MHLSPTELETVRHILAAHAKSWEVRAFGSRVTGQKLKPFSDLDLVVMTTEHLPAQIYTHIKNAFTISTLPFRVDVMDCSTLTPDFRKVIENQYEVVQTAE